MLDVGSIERMAYTFCLLFQRNAATMLARECAIMGHARLFVDTRRHPYTTPTPAALPSAARRQK